jgi:hypothetical protein
VFNSSKFRRATDGSFRFIRKRTEVSFFSVCSVLIFHSLILKSPRVLPVSISSTLDGFGDSGLIVAPRLQ